MKTTIVCFLPSVVMVLPILNEPSLRNSTVWYDSKALVRPGIAGRSVSVFHKPAKPCAREHPRVFTEAQRLREAKLPNETGGVLLGSIDTHHRRIHVIDLLPSPSDSKEWPNLYIRGAAGLSNRVRAISKATHNNIDYIGEWHSHPPHSSAQPSGTDRIALATLADEMSLCGLPALMLIVAGPHRHQFHINCNF